MTNGAMNVEIGNPTYKMYEGDPDADDVGELLDADFALDPDKVWKRKWEHMIKELQTAQRCCAPSLL